MKLLLFFQYFVGCFVCSIGQQPTYLFGGHHCGQRFGGAIGRLPPVGISAHISGGRNMTEGEMPWMVHLTVSYADATSQSCGGFILDENWVITAAHCLVSVVSVKVSAGRLSYEWGSDNRNEQVMLVPVTGIHVHSDYNRLTMLNDIGLLHLPRSLRFNQHVQPICILDQDSCGDPPLGSSSQVDFCDTNVTSAGWGFNQSGLISNYLKSVDLEIMPRDQCNHLYTTLSFRPIYPQQICAQGHQSGDDTCKGDSGGPLFCYQNGKAVAIGIISFGPTNCRSVVPGGYNRICQHLDWIKRIVSSSNNISTISPDGCQIPNRHYGSQIVQISNGNQLREEEFVPVGSIVRVSCASGFIENFPGRRSICINNGGWVPPIGDCRPIRTRPVTTTSTSTATTTTPNTTIIGVKVGQCSQHPSFPNAQVDGFNNQIGSQRVVYCNDGFKSSGRPFFFITCQPNLEWSNSGNCVMSMCPEISVVANGIVSPGSRDPGAQRFVVCNDGYKVQGLSIAYIYCLRSLQWTDPGDCERVKVVPPPMPPPSPPPPTTTTSTTRSSSTTKTTTTTTIPRQCPNSPLFPNAYVWPGESQIGSQRIVNCNDGFINNSLPFAIIHCQNNSEWSHPGQCERFCLDPLDVPNGVISNGSNNIGNQRLVTCRPGYTLTGSTSIICLTNGNWSIPGSCSKGWKKIAIFFFSF